MIWLVGLTGIVLFACIHFTVVTALVSAQIAGMLMRGVGPLRPEQRLNWSTKT